MNFAEITKALTNLDWNDLRDKSGQPENIGTTNEFQPGTALGGRYEVVSLLGRGGMGLVYRVKQIFVNKEFALKTIDKSLMSEIAVRRFQQEAQAAFSLKHPNIIAVNDFGVLDDQTPFLVMELLDGETLGERIERTGRLTLEQAIPIFVQICFALAYAHDCGVVHRDVKPNNIMLLNDLPPGAEGSIKILDFGIAKFTGREGGEIQALTRTGEIFGSPLYMSPEQCNGVIVDHRADVYSLGCVFYEALTGAPPFVGDNALSTMMKHQSEQALTLKQASLGSDFPQAIENIVATMLAKSPDSRYQNLGLLAHDLETVRRGGSVSLKPSMTSLPSNASTNPVWQKNALILVSLALVSICGYLLHEFQAGRFLVPPKQEVSKSKIDPLDSVFANAQPNLFVVKPDELQKLLAKSPADHKLDLNNTEISTEALNAIAAVGWIHDLTLRDCDLDNLSLRKLAKLKDLSVVDLNGTNLDDDGCAGLSACKNLSIIYANDTQITDKGLKDLASMPGLALLVLTGTHIQDAGLAALSHTSIQTLELANTDVGDAGLFYLSKMSQLSNVGLSKTKITSAGLAPLAQTPIQTLDLTSTNIDDLGMVHLSKMSRLSEVVLNETKVTIDGVQMLCRNKQVKSIRVKNCPKLREDDINKLRMEFPATHFLLN